MPPRLKHGYGAVTEWWAPTLDGLEQGFDVAASDGDLGSVDIVVDEVLAVDSDREDLRMLDTSGRAWSVSALAAWDANGSTLPAALAPTEAGFRVEVDVSRAVFRVTVDPVYAPDDVDLPNGARAAASSW